MMNDTAPCCAAIFILTALVFSLNCWAADTSAGGRTEAFYYPPPESQGGWRKTTDPAKIRSLGMDPAKVQEFLDYNISIRSAERPDRQYKSCMVIKNGWIVGEKYNRPEAQAFRQYLSSNGKSVAMVALGIVVEDGRKGRIPQRIGLDSKLYQKQWLPEGFPLSDPRKEQITFHQVLKHRSGICPEDKENGRNKWGNYVDWVVGHSAKWPQTGELYFEPGAKSWYSSVAFCHLGLVFHNIYQVRASDFIRQRIFKPIGVEKITFVGPPGNGIEWFSAGGVQLTPRDYARFAYLLLRDGKWKDKPIVPSSWIVQFRTSDQYQNMTSNINGEFGKQYPKDLFRIGGSGLNWAYMIPSLDLIAIRTSRSYNQMWNEVRGHFLQKLFAAVLPRQPADPVAE